MPSASIIRSNHLLPTKTSHLWRILQKEKGDPNNKVKGWMLGRTTTAKMDKNHYEIIARKLCQSS